MKRHEILLLFLLIGWFVEVGTWNGWWLWCILFHASSSSSTGFFWMFDGVESSLHSYLLVSSSFILCFRFSFSMSSFLLILAIGTKSCRWGLDGWKRWWFWMKCSPVSPFLSFLFLPPFCFLLAFFSLCLFLWVKHELCITTTHERRGLVWYVALSIASQIYFNLLHFYSYHIDGLNFK